MQKFNLVAGIFTLLAAAGPSFAQEPSHSQFHQIQLAQAYACGKTCGRVSSCREAVYQWCICGYSRADGDKDGIPCEAVCGQSTPTTLERIKSYKRELGCR